MIKILSIFQCAICKSKEEHEFKTTKDLSDFYTENEKFLKSVDKIKLIVDAFKIDTGSDVIDYVCPDCHNALSHTISTKFKQLIRYNPNDVVTPSTETVPDDLVFKEEVKSENEVVLEDILNAKKEEQPKLNIVDSSANETVSAAKKQFAKKKLGDIVLENANNA